MDMFLSGTPDDKKATAGAIGHGIAAAFDGVGSHMVKINSVTAARPLGLVAGGAGFLTVDYELRVPIQVGATPLSSGSSIFVSKRNTSTQS